MSITSITKDTQAGRPFFQPYPDKAARIDVIPIKRMLGWMKFINLHGPQSSLYLYEHDGLKQYDDVRKKLTLLWKAGYVYRPKQQSTNGNLKYCHLTYDLTAKGIRFLKDTGEWIEALRPSGPWVHQFMTSSITATMDIMCKREGYTFIPAHEILKDTPLKCPVTYTWENKKKTRNLIPDSIFAIAIGKSHIFYAVEADRNTEGNTSTKGGRKTADENFAQYAAFRDVYKDHYDVNAPLVVLNATTSPAHIQNCLDLIEKPNPYLAFNLAPDFGYYWQPPKLMTHLFTDGWLRKGKPDFYIKK